jgi:hypothetical protein
MEANRTTFGGSSSNCRLLDEPARRRLLAANVPACFQGSTFVLWLKHFI